jgi:hypothetical protein
MIQQRASRQSNMNYQAWTSDACMVTRGSHPFPCQMQCGSGTQWLNLRTQSRTHCSSTQHTQTGYVMKRGGASQGQALICILLANPTKQNAKPCNAKCSHDKCFSFFQPAEMANHTDTKRGSNLKLQIGKLEPHGLSQPNIIVQGGLGNTRP